MPDLTPETLTELRERALMSRCYSGGRAVGIAPDELDALLDAAERLAEVAAERDALAAAVERVRALHPRDDDWCPNCGQPHPCDTRRALDGTETDNA